MMNTKKNAHRQSTPTLESVDCIVFAILKEEKDFFIKFAQERDFFGHKVCRTNTCTHSELAAEELLFIDRNHIIRRCIVCSFERKENIKQMGNAAAYKLLYIISRHYKSDFYINVGVAGAFGKKVRLGDVFLVSQNISVTKKDSNGGFSQNTPDTDRSTVQSVFDKIKDDTNAELHQLIIKRIIDRLEEAKQDKDIHKLLDEKKVALTDGTLQQGRCITFPYVLKNKEELLVSEISSLKDWDIVDMEAYYFTDWFSLMKRIDCKHCSKNSKLLIVKSPSDTCEEALKDKLSKARELAMGNICEYLSVYLSEMHEFSNGKVQRDDCEKYIHNKFDEKHLPSCLNEELKNDDYNGLFSLIAEINPLGDSFSISKLGTEMEKIDNSIIITGGPGKGENILLALIYKSCSSKKIYIDFAQLDNKQCSIGIICKCLKYIFDRTSNNYAVFLANLDRANSEMDARGILTILDSCKDKFSFCVTYNANSDKTDYQFITDIKQRINANKEIIEVTLNNICSYNRDTVGNYIKCYAELFLPRKTAEEKAFFIKNCSDVIEYKDIFKKEIKHVDWQLMQLFSEFSKMFMKTRNLYICEIISEYCAKNNLDKIISEAMKKESIDSRSFGVLEANVYCRAFIYARYLYNILFDDDIEKLNKYNFYLSDSIDYFMQYLLKNSKGKDKITRTVLENIDKIKSDIQHELLYLISKNVTRNNALYFDIKNIIQGKINLINLKDIKNDEGGCVKIIKYRTYALCMKVFGNTEYLHLFVDELKTGRLFQNVNLSFYLNYYSQKEFTYSDVFSLSAQMKEKISGIMLYNSLYKLIRILDEKTAPFDAESLMYYHTLKSLTSVAEKNGLTDKINKFPNIDKIQEIDAKFDERVQG